MLGKVSRILEDKRFGFIKDVEGNYFFFHQQTVSPESPLKFDELKVGQEVSFEPSSRVIDGVEKTRAENVCFIC